MSSAMKGVSVQREFSSWLVLTLLMTLPLFLASPARAAGFEPLEWKAEIPEQPETVLVRGATVWTSGPRGTLQNADLLVRNGKIVEVGSGLPAPGNAVVVEAAGLHVTPGIIDAHSHSAVEGDVNEGTNIITAEVRIEDVLNPEDISLYRQLAGGVTTAHVLHGSANAIGGQDAVIKLRWGVEEPRELLLEGAPPGIKFALGENPKQSNWGSANSRYPQTRSGVEQVIRESFLAAQDYRREWKEFQARSNRGEPRVPPRRDLQLEALVEVMEGKRLVHAHCYRADEILMLIRVAEEFGFRIATFQHVLEGYKVADEIAAHGAGASTFIDWWGFKYEAREGIPYNGAIMHQRGVLVSFNSDDDNLARRLNQDAAKAVRYGGVSEEDALRFVTLNPAIQLGIDRWVGSLEAGKDADFVVWSGSPLSTFSRVEQTWIDGRKYFDREADLGGRPEILRQRAELLAQVAASNEADKDEKEEADETDDPGEGGTTEAVEPEAESAVEAEAEAAPEVSEAKEPRDVLIPAARPTSRPIPPPTGSPTLALVGATLHPVDGPVIENGVLLLAGDVISRLGGADTPVPEGIEVIDLAGRHLYPGFLHPASHLGLVEVESVRGTLDVGEIGTFNPHLRAQVAVNPDSQLLAVAASGGVLGAHVIPEGGTLSGTSAVLRVEGWTWEDMTVRAPVGMHLRFPGGGGGGGHEHDSGEDESAGDESKALTELNAFLADARAYGKARRAAASGEGPAVAADPRLEALLPVLSGELPLFLHAADRARIKAALDWAEEEGVDYFVLVAGADVVHFAERLGAAGISVILDEPFDLPARAWEPYDAGYSAPAALHRAGVPFALAADPIHNARNLPFRAAAATAFGLPREEALASVTLRPAEILGVADRLGSLTAGKEATFFVADGDPLEITTHIERVWIAGRELDLGNDPQRRLYEKYLARPRSE